MADRVPPIVRLVLPCDDASLDLADEKWVLKNPWAAVGVPPGERFPFRLADAWVYAQFGEGVGTFELAIQVRHVRDDGSRRTVGSGGVTRLTLPGGNALVVYDMVFHLRRLPFRGPGLYEFALIADAGEGGAWEPLAGATAVVRVFDSGRTL